MACVDSTHKTNEYGYKLITLLVIDEFRKGKGLTLSHCVHMNTCQPTFCAHLGQPVAWAITDIEDAQTYQEFFTAVKKRVPDANVTLLMADDGKGDCTQNPSLPYLYFQILRLLQHAQRFTLV